jgi:sulfate transport system ATP-binding protein/sulfonate transport system ATP-binding protein
MGTGTLRLVGARKTYAGRCGDVTVFAGLDLEVRRGEVLALVGPSGCGKSTLLRVLAGLEPLTGGRVEREGVRTGVVFQEPLLLPWRSVRANITLGLGYRANRRRASDADVDELIGLLGLSAIADAWPDQLSGGQAQRVAIARAVLTRPDVLLADEPFAALDPAARLALQDWLLELRDLLGLTVVIVTHDINEALRVGDRVTLMGTGAVGIEHVWEIRHDRSHEVGAEIRSRFRTDVGVSPQPVAAGSIAHELLA